MTTTEIRNKNHMVDYNIYMSKKQFISALNVALIMKDEKALGWNCKTIYEDKEGYKKVYKHNTGIEITKVYRAPKNVYDDGYMEYY